MEGGVCREREREIGLKEGGRESFEGESFEGEREGGREGRVLRERGREGRVLREGERVEF